MVEAQCLCRSAWRKSDKSNKKRRVSTESETQTPHLYHCFVSFVGRLWFYLSSICMHLLDRGIQTKKGWKNHGIFQRGRHQRPRHLDQWSHGSLVQKCTAPVGKTTSRCSFMCEKPRNSRCTKNTSCTFTSICEKFTNLEHMMAILKS